MRRGVTQAVADVDRICYRTELARAERHMEETCGDGEGGPDPRACHGHELGDCWACANEASCFPGPRAE